MTINHLFQNFCSQCVHFETLIMKYNHNFFFSNYLKQVITQRCMTANELIFSGKLCFCKSSNKDSSYELQKLIPI